MQPIEDRRLYIPLFFCAEDLSVVGESVSFCQRGERRVGLYEGLLEERADEAYRRDVHPMLRFYIENGARSMGSGMHFASLKRRYPEDYAYLMEEKVQRRLF